MTRIQSVAVVANPEKKLAQEESRRLGSWLQRRHIKVFNKAQMKKAEAILTLGGDGTILSVATEAAQLGIPVLGINLGRVGFMTAVGVKGLYPSLARWLQGGYEVSERMMLEVKPPRTKNSFLALNDAVIRTGSTSRVTRVFASIENEELGFFTGDGVIVATSTGSTAYSLSAQGPVVHPELEALILTPICAHSFTQRPVVFPAHQHLELSLQDQREGNEVQLCLDGQRRFSLRSGDTVEVTGSNFKLKLLQDPKNPYFEVLRKKLLWGEK